MDMQSVVKLFRYSIISAKALKPIAYENKQRMKYGYAISCQVIQIFYLFSSYQLAHTVRQSVSKSVIH